MSFHRVHPRSPVLAVARLAVVAAVLLAAGCGGSTRLDAPPTPQRVPSGSIAIVGTVPVTTTSFNQWLAIISGGRAATGAAARTRLQHVERTVSFLVKAQWLVQEAAAERINESVLEKLALARIANIERGGMTRLDAVFQARLDVISEALQSRHSAAPVTESQIASYYAAHRSQFRDPASRNTLTVITRDRATALRAKAALTSGESWPVVSKRWSIGSAILKGAAYPVVEGVQPPTLVRAVFAARPGRIIGPVRASSAAEPRVRDYYLFEVTGGGRPASSQPLAQVAARIRHTLTEEQGERSLAAFTRAYEERWRGRTLCAPGYVVAECRNDRVARRREGS
jgi:hypothetical protein